MAPRELVRDSAFRGISRFVHALLYDLGPLVLVEGKTDKALLDRAYSIRKPSVLRSVHCLATLSNDSTDKGGVETVLGYLKDNASVISSRPLDAPIVVLLDWEEKEDKLAKFKASLSIHPSSKALRCDECASNPDLDDSFVGIERFLSTRMIEWAGDEGLLKLSRPRTVEYPLSVTKRSLEAAKTAIADHVVSKGTDEDFEFMAKLVDRIEDALRYPQSATSSPMP